MKTKFVFFVLIFFYNLTFSQGLSNNWLLGYLPIPLYQATSGKGILSFNTGIAAVYPHTRKMRFDWTQANFSDKYGNLLMSSNGIFIADASGDTMLNGSGLNPGLHTSSLYSIGSNLPDANLFLPFPGDSSKVILLHEGSNHPLSPTVKLYLSIIDMTLNGGLGAVIQKNIIPPLPDLNGGISACQHANGRDWWILVPQDSSNVIWKILFTPTGITSITSQAICQVATFHSSDSQTKFSPDGKKFAFVTQRFLGPLNNMNIIQYFNFNRCSGMLSEPAYMQIPASYACFSLSFSPNSKLLYTCNRKVIYQVNLDSTTIDTIAVYDGFGTPPGNYSNEFVQMYLAGDGRIYVSSLSSTLTLHYITYPDSVGIACNVQQHAFPVPCYSYATVPNHPNYFLGVDSGSVCDTLLSLKEYSFQNKNKQLQAFPNPAYNELNFNYTPTEKNQILELIDVQGNVLLQVKLPPWSQTQTVDVSKLPAGIYQCRLLEDAVTCKFVKLPSRAGE